MAISEVGFVPAAQASIANHCGRRKTRVVKASASLGAISTATVPPMHDGPSSYVDCEAPWMRGWRYACWDAPTCSGL